MADQLAVAINNARLHQQNEQLFRQAARRAQLLQVGAEVSRNITSILDLDVLLASTVYIICEEYGFYYAGIFLVDPTPDEEGHSWARLKAGRGEAGRRMVEQGYKLEVGGASLVGAAIVTREARIALNVNAESVWQPNPYLPATRSEMALPLIVQGDVIGVLTVQSVEATAFSEDDISSLQMMADQLAVAINNARLLQDLEAASQELVRAKTFESIATATGETIHWVGNKAAPIPASVARLREDLARFLYLSGEFVGQLAEGRQNDPLAQLIMAAAHYLSERYPEVEGWVEKLRGKPLAKVQRLLAIESMLEDLDIIEQSGNTILQIKEDLIGPTRWMKLQPADIVQIVQQNVKGFVQPPATVLYSIDGEIPPVKVDPVQMDRVIINLIKNALEAMDEQPQPQLFVAIRRESRDYVIIELADNGCGIPEAELTKIWLTFHTSKAKKGGTGLGLPACLQIMERMRGKISVVSQVGVGSTFTLYVPVYRPGDDEEAA
jgi:signal transduction histidine kinase